MWINKFSGDYVKERLCNGQKKRSIAAIILVNLFAHWFLLLLSGRWWDDWCQYGQTLQNLFQQAMELGRPSSYYVVLFSRFFPETGYRVVVFFMFCVSSICIYKIVKSLDILTEEECMWISILFSVIPVNDARVLLSVFSYSVGHFFYWMGFYVLTLVLRTCGYRHVLLRVASLLMFACSFTLNSNLVYYAVVLLYILYQKKKWKECKKYIDYLLAPIIFFALKSVFFPPYGIYENYNSITLKGLVNAVRLIPGACIYVLIKVAAALHLPECAVAVAGYMAVKKLWIHMRPGGNAAQQEYSAERTAWFCVVCLTVGFALLASGLFPYVAIREAFQIQTEGVAGRDSILSTLGIAVVFFSIITFLDKYKVKKILLFVMVLLGTLFFNKQYLIYQSDYYRQLAFQYVLEERAELKNMENILFLEEKELPIDATRFYSLNANAEQVYGDQTRFIMDGFSDMKYLDDEPYVKAFVERDYHMSGYRMNHREIDAIIRFNCDLSYKDVLQLKLLELGNRQHEFRNVLKNKTQADIYCQGTEKYEQMLATNVGN